MVIPAAAPPHGSSGEEPDFRVPPPLRAGDTVALFSPGSHGGREEETLIAGGAKVLESWGLKPLPREEAPPRHLYLAGTDPQRAAQFQSLYCNPAIRGLFATRGGYGTARMLPFLDAGRIAGAEPKPVVGMSDVVALFSYLQRVARIVTYHGPCLGAPGMERSSPREGTQLENLEELRALLFDPSRRPAFSCRYLQDGKGARGKRRVEARGPLLGGNLAVLAASLGTGWAPDCRGAVLFIEEVNEAPYRVDRYLTQFRQAGGLEEVAGLVFGQFTRCEAEQPGLLEAALRDLFQDAPYPVATGLEAGHGDRNRTLPLGRAVRLAPAVAGEEGSALLQVL